MSNWSNKNQHLNKVFKFKNYKETMTFVNGVADLANQQNHHPEMIVNFKTCEISITTHDAGNTITEKDHLLADTIDSYFTKLATK